MKMKKITNLLLAGALLLIGVAAQAQISIGPRLGFNAANVDFGAKDYDAPNLKTKLGSQIGVALNAQFGNLALQPAIIYSRKGFLVDRSVADGDSTWDMKSNIRLNYIEIPVHLVYTGGGNTGFQVFAGPYIGLGLDGNIDWESRITKPNVSTSSNREIDVNFASKQGPDDKMYFRRFDLGANAGIGYKAGPIQTQLGYGYGFGFSNLVTKGFYDEEPKDKIRNRVVQLSVAYLVGI